MPTVSDIKYAFRHVWWFATGLCANVKQWFLDTLGNIRFYRCPMWFVVNPSRHRVTAWHIRKALKALERGDVIVRKYDTYLMSYFIPGRFSHSCVYVGGSDDRDYVVHALGTGVQMTDVIDFLMCCDEFAILRPKCGSDIKSKACDIAKSYIGAQYDYRFDICEDYSNKDEVDKRTKSVYCHELTRSCYPTLNIPTVQPQLWNGMVRSSKRQFLAQSFFDSPDFEVVYDSFYSEVH